MACVERDLVDLVELDGPKVEVRSIALSHSSAYVRTDAVIKHMDCSVTATFTVTEATMIEFGRLMIGTDTK
jgi:hypothetical protein